MKKEREMRLFLFGIFIIIMSSCTAGGSVGATKAEDTAGATSSGTDYSPDDAIDSFTGSASPDELSILLSNSNLGCEVDQFLKFDGSNWVCGDLPQTSLSLGSGSETCSSSNANVIDYDSSANTYKVCNRIPGSSTYAWTTITGVINDNATINIPAGDCTAFYNVLKDLAKFKINQDARIDVQLADGTYNCAATIDIYKADLSSVWITGNETTPSNVVLSFNDTHGIILHATYLRYLNGLRIVQAGTANSMIALAADAESHIGLGPAIEIADFTTTGSVAIAAGNNSSIHAVGWSSGTAPTLSNNLVGLRSLQSSSIIAPHIVISGVGSGNTAGRGVQASIGSNAEIYDATISNTYYGVESVNNSSIYANNVDVTSSHQAFVAHFSGYITASDSTAAGCEVCYTANVFGVLNSGNSVAECQGGGNSGFLAGAGGMIYAVGSSVNLSNCTGGANNFNEDVNSQIIGP